MSAPTLNTITGQDWREMFAEFQASGRREGSVMLMQIRAAMHKERPALFNPFSEPTESKTGRPTSGPAACENQPAISARVVARGLV